MRIARCQRILGHAQQFIDAIVDHADRNRGGGVPHPAILDHADVELHDVAVLDPPLAADSVHDFVVQRNANVAGKTRCPSR